MRIWVASNAIFHTYPRSSAISDLLTFLKQTLLIQGFSKRNLFNHLPSLLVCEDCFKTFTMKKLDIDKIFSHIGELGSQQKRYCLMIFLLNVYGAQM